MTSFTKSATAGNTECWLGFLDSNGFLAGSSPTAPSQGAAGSAMVRLYGIKEAPVAVPEQDVVQVTGDDDLIAEFDFTNIGTRSFVAEFAVEDLNMVAQLQGTLVETVGEIKMTGLDVIAPAELNVCLILQSRAKKIDAGVRGQKGWAGVIIPVATAKPLGRNGFSERTPGVYRLQITPQTASNHPWGISILDANAGTSGQRFTVFTAENPITMHAHSGNGALSTFTLDYAPVSAAKTKVYSARVAQTTSSVSTSAPYSVTITGTPIGAAQMITVYEYSA